MFTNLTMFFFTVLSAYILLVSASDPDKHCSKFHYEEKLLEKIIRMEIRMEEMQKHIDNLEMRLELTENSDLTSKEKETTIAFFATALSHRIYTRDQVVIFENVVTNLGHAYNPECSTFTAPEPGVYVFASTVLGSNDVELWNYFTVNDQRIANFNSHGTEGRHDSGTAFVILKLRKGDKVAVKNQSDRGGTHGDNYSHFSGFRISL